jgi:hypothetical protein
MVLEGPIRITSLHIVGFYCQSFNGYLSIVAAGYVVNELIVEYEQPQS